MEGDSLVLGIADSPGAAPKQTVRGWGASIAIGQVPTTPQGFEQLSFRMMRRTVNGKTRVVGLEAFDPATNVATGLVVQGAAMTIAPFKKGPKPFVEDRETFAAAVAQQANDDDVPELSRGVEPSIHQSAINIPLANETSK